jgi:uncharacterized membrane protein
MRENIAVLAERRRQEEEQAPFSDRLADRITLFVGSMRFIVIHVVLYAFWLLANLTALPGIPQFDPTLVFLAMEASVEAIFLSTFVLISQNRMAAAADRRADLDLHINLLAEHELTKVAQLLERIAHRLDLPQADPSFDEVKEDVAPETVLDALDEGSTQPPGAGIGSAMKASKAS